MADIGTGSTITRGGSSLGAVLSINPPNQSVGTIIVSDMESEAVEKLPTRLIDGGQVSIEILIDGSGDIPDAGQVVAGTHDAFVITYPDASTQSFNGWISAVTPAVPLEDKMTCSITIEVNGAVS